jgi:hypothetical protein
LSYSTHGCRKHTTHRIAQSNARIPGLDGDNVHLRCRDYRDGEHKTLVLEAPELIRRFLLHVLPKGLMPVRHYGLLANRCRGAKGVGPRYPIE